MDDINLPWAAAECVRTCQCISCSMIRGALKHIDNASAEDLREGARLIKEMIGDVPSS